MRSKGRRFADLKSRISVQDVLLFVRNTGDMYIIIDFPDIQFATPGFIDEFYNTFIKDGRAFPVILANLPEDTAYMPKIVSTTQDNPKQIETAGEVTCCTSLEELQRILASI